MCCLTIYKDENNQVIFTHNRDENISRNASFLLSKVGKTSFFTAPIDPVSNGTWIGSNGVLTAALLNGANTNHEKKFFYKQSRGSIIPTFFECQDINAFMSSFDPCDFEPFTLLLFNKSEDRLVEIIWNEITLEERALDTDKAHIYSSSTLYTDNIKNERKSLFHDYISKPQTAESIMDLHSKEGIDHNQYFNVTVTKEIKTLSIIQIIHGTIPTIKYLNLKENKYVEMPIQVT
jgi:uncharacterized protein with NRDE domain